MQLQRYPDKSGFFALIRKISLRPWSGPFWKYTFVKVFNITALCIGSSTAVQLIMVRIGRTWSEFGLFFLKSGPKKVWISQQKSDFSVKVAYLTTCPEYEYETFIPEGMLDNLKVVKLWKRVWFYLIFGPILVWFSIKVRSDSGRTMFWQNVELFENIFRHRAHFWGDGLYRQPT